MEITLPLLILCIPLFNFLLLGIGGYKMSHKMACIIGVAGMGITAILSYTVALTYFSVATNSFRQLSMEA